ncbi:hypothetical protein EDD85DRAFT_393560 [Armillaria nabsnona]|nr:hypothetical protein EDD85DRAFT_393560 [Armillaria nabsnona]
MAKIQNLSQELIDSFIDEFKDDQQTLKTCALVCRAFLPRVRTHRFQNISLMHDEQSSSLIALCRASPHIPAYITSLCMKWVSVASDATLQFLRLLSNLQHLRLFHCFTLDKVQPYIPTQNLHSLTLDTVSFRDSTELKGYIALFPSLQRLSLVEIMFLGKNHGFSTDKENLHLDALSINFGTKITDFAVCPIKDLRRLAARFGTSHVPPLRTLLQDNHDTLQDLYLQFFSTWVDSTPSIDLSLTRLQNITFEVWQGSATAFGRSALKWSMHTLATTPSTNVHFLLVIYNPPENDQSVWRDLPARHSVSIDIAPYRVEHLENCLALKALLESEVKTKAIKVNLCPETKPFEFSE